MGLQKQQDENIKYKRHSDFFFQIHARFLDLHKYDLCSAPVSYLTSALGAPTLNPWPWLLIPHDYAQANVS